MREYEVAIDGRAHKVQLGDLKFGTPVGVIVDGKTVEVTVRQVPGSSNRFILKVAGVSFDAEIETSPERAPKIVRVNGKPFVASVREAILSPTLLVAHPPRASLRAATLRAGISANVIAAPIPGRVVSLFVKDGDKVRPGQHLLLLEAMKMENEIVAHKSGTVKSIKVVEGSAVNKGDPLLEIA